MAANGILESMAWVLLRGLPTWLAIAFGFVLYISKRHERPKAANFVLIALVLEMCNVLFGPLVIPLLFNMLPNPNQFTMALVSLVVYLPGVLGFALLLYAAMLPDQASQRRYRRYDEDEFETLEDEPRR